MITWFKSLSTIWKVVVIAGILILAVFIYDWFTGGISNLKGYLNEKAYKERMEKDAEYEKQIAELKAKNLELDKKLIESEARGKILEENDKALSQKTKEELEKLDAALAAQDAEEARTAQPTDAFTRCERTKQKMLSLGIETAKEIHCEDRR